MYFHFKGLRNASNMSDTQFLKSKEEGKDQEHNNSVKLISTD